MKAIEAESNGHRPGLDLKAQRKRLGLTAKQVGEMVGVSDVTVLRWESGEIANMRTNKLVAYAAALQLSPLAIIGMEVPDKEEEKTEEAVIAEKIAGSYDLHHLLDVAMVSQPEDVQIVTKALRRMNRDMS